jgi:uncharacterized membrane protein
VGTAGQTYGLKWESPYAQPTKLLAPPLPYPVQQVLPMGINNSGDVAGWVVVAVRRNTIRYDAVVWSAAGTPTALPLAPGATSQTANAINDAGVISGAMNSRYPVRWTPDGAGGYNVAVLNVDTNGNTRSGIDACGRIVGGSPAGAWVWDSQGVTMLPSIGGMGLHGWSDTINEEGQMVGLSKAGQAKQAELRATLWTGLAPCTP